MKRMLFFYSFYQGLCLGPIFPAKSQNDFRQVDGATEHRYVIVSSQVEGGRRFFLHRPNCILILFEKLSVVVMADTGAGPSQKRRKSNEEQLKAKRESER